MKEWVQQIGFPQFTESFVESRVDGDLLLQLTEAMVREDIQMRNGILRRRFLRELADLRKKADYSEVDSTGLNEFCNRSTRNDQSTPMTCSMLASTGKPFSI